MNRLERMLTARVRNINLSKRGGEREPKNSPTYGCLGKFWKKTKNKMNTITNNKFGLLTWKL